VYVPEGELRPLRAIEAAEAWCRGEATTEEVRNAADDVAKVATHAAIAAIFVAYATKPTLVAYIGDAVYLAYVAVTVKDTKQELCDIIRKHITWEMIESGIRSQ
jgi:hypothetical protein